MSDALDDIRRAMAEFVSTASPVPIAASVRVPRDVWDACLVAFAVGDPVLAPGEGRIAVFVDDCLPPGMIVFCDADGVPIEVRRARPASGSGDPTTTPPDAGS